VPKSWSFLAVSLLLLSPGLVRADALRKVDEAAADEASAPVRTHSSSHYESNASSTTPGDDVIDENDRQALRDRVLLVLMPWTLPIAVMDEPCLRGYARHPYADGHGQLRAVESACKRPSTRRPDDAPRSLAAQLDMGSGYMANQVVPATLALRLQLPQRFELSARASLLSDFAEPSTERAMNDSAVIAYRFAQSGRADLRSGLGMRHYRLEKGGDRWGFDALYGLDFFARRHVVGRVELHLGSLDRAVVFETRATLGVMLGRFEPYAGGDFMAVVGSSQTAKLGGAVAGVRLWF
jgi:hypothetical protein